MSSLYSPFCQCVLFVNNEPVPLDDSYQLHFRLVDGRIRPVLYRHGEVLPAVFSINVVAEEINQCAEK